MHSTIRAYDVSRKVSMFLYFCENQHSTQPVLQKLPTFYSLPSRSSLSLWAESMWGLILQLAHFRHLSEPPFPQKKKDSLSRPLFPTTNYRFLPAVAASSTQPLNVRHVTRSHTQMKQNPFPPPQSTRHGVTPAALCQQRQSK